MRRLSSVAFATLAAATVAAFFITQHLKVSTPLIAGFPRPDPAAINPVDGRVCAGRDHAFTRISFYLLNRADNVDVEVISDQSGDIVATVASNHHMRKGVRKPDGEFSWNGREADGKVAPDGTYYFRVVLRNQGRTVDLSNTPVKVITVPPRPVVTSVSPSLSTGGAPVTIHYSGDTGKGATVLLYRTDLPGKPRLVKSFGTGSSDRAVWNGRIDGRPAPAGTYLVALRVTDAACNTGTFPAVLPPTPGTTPHAGVTVRYLAAAPPPTPVPSGSNAAVGVDARGQPYSWTLRRDGTSAPIATGHARSYHLAVKLPAPGLYELALRSGSHDTTVPLVASPNPTAASAPGILVVLPTLTWQGRNPVDDTGSGIPDTLDAGLPIQLDRPLANGLPSGFADEWALLAYLEKTRRRYDLTTDLGLIEGVGPGLSGHRGVVLAGSERWLPSSLSAALRGYVENGGHVLSLGVDSLRRGVVVQGTRALDPTPPSSTDRLGAELGGVLTGNRSPIRVSRDGMGIFTGTSGVFTGFRSYRVFKSVTSGAHLESAAGTSPAAPSIIGYRLGRGAVIDIGLFGFGLTLTRHDLQSEKLINRVWAVLAR